MFQAIHWLKTALLVMLFVFTDFGDEFDSYHGIDQHVEQGEGFEIDSLHMDHDLYWTSFVRGVAYIFLGFTFF